MTPPTATSADHVAWDLDPLLDGNDVDGLLAEADALAGAVEAVRGRVADLDARALADTMADLAALHERLG